MAIKKISEFVSATPTSEDKILFEHNGSGKSTALADLPIPTKVQTALNDKADESSRLRAVRRSITASQWAYDSLLYLGIHNGNPIVSIKTSSGYVVPATVPNDPMWYAAVYHVDGTRITSGTFTLEVVYLYKGIES